MPLRSILFVPADSERKLEKSLGCPADAFILDLEDAVAEARKPLAREMAAKFVAAHPAKAQLYVRINALDTPWALADLAGVVGPGLAGIVVPKMRSTADLVRVGHCLDVLEVKAGMAPGTVRLIPVATETPHAMLSMQGFTTPLARLAAVTWGAEDLSAAVGALSNREESGAYSPLYDLAGSLCLAAAAAAEVPALDTLFADFKDAAGLERSCRISRRRGFKGRLAIHPDQVAVLNAAYSPTGAELDHARKIVAAFAAQPDAGVVSIEGAMFDKPHLTQAQRTLGLKP